MTPKAVPSQSPPHLASKQTSVNMTADMRRDVEELSAATYGQRGLARWIEDALESFVQSPGYIFRLGAGEPRQALSTRKVIRLTPHAEAILVEALKTVRKVDPTLENVRALLLRAAFAHAIRNAKPAVAESAASNDEAGLVAPHVPGMRPRKGREGAGQGAAATAQAPVVAKKAPSIRRRTTR